MARPATRNPIRPETATRPAVRDFTGSGGFTIEWDIRPVYDFLFSLSGDAGSTDDLPASDRAWLTDARATLPGDLRASASRLFESELVMHVAALAIARPEVRSAAQLVAAIRESTPAEIIKAIFSESVNQGDLGALIDRLADGDTSVLPQVEDCLPDWKRQDRLALLQDPAALKSDIVGVLDAWSTPFGAIEDRISAMLDRDYALRADDRVSLSTTELVERTTGGIRWLGEPGVRRVILAPSYFSRPYNFVLGGAGWRFFGYPLADAAVDAVDPLAPPLAVVRLHRALGDETRMRILKLLSRQDLYLTEIAQQLELSKPTIKHHLAILRSAGLVTITETGTLMYYTLRRQRLDDASTDLKRFLVGTEGSDGSKRLS